MYGAGFYIRFPIIIVCILSITIVTSCNRYNQTDMSTIPYAYELDEKSVKTDEETGIHYVDNIVLVFFDIGTAEEEKMRVVIEIDGKLVGRIDSIDQFQIQVPSRSLDDLKELCSQIDDMDGVISTSFDIAYQDVSLDYIPNDPWGGNQNWNVQTPDGNNWWAEVIDAPGAWEYKDELANVKVGVVDNGFDYQHEDLKMELLLEGIVNKKDHGTGVAGIIGATGDNKRGITGIAPNASLICYDWKLDDYDEDVAEKVKWDTSTAISTGLVVCVENGAKIINYSVGLEAPPGNSYSNEVIQAWGENESRYIASLLYRGYDFLVIQSAGNGGQNKIGIDAINNGHYASITKNSCTSIGIITVQDILDRILIVGATEKTNHLNNMFLTSFSNCGKQVEIVAPGREIYTTKKGGYYDCEPESGTSFSAPIVSGVAALVWGANEKLTGAQVKEILCSSTNKYAKGHPLTKIEGTYPVVNARLAVEKSLESNAESQFNKKLVNDNIIAKTWYSENYNVDADKWGSNRTEFNADGTVSHIGFRYKDTGTYEVLNNNTIKAVYNENYLDAPEYGGYTKYNGYAYEAVYQYNAANNTLYVEYSDSYENVMADQTGNGLLYDHQGASALPQVTIGSNVQNYNGDLVLRINNVETIENGYKITADVCETGYASEDYLKTFKIGNKIRCPEIGGRVISNKEAEDATITDINYENGITTIYAKGEKYIEEYDWGWLQTSFTLSSEIMVGWIESSMDWPIYNIIESNVVFYADKNTIFISADKEYNEQERLEYENYGTVFEDIYPQNLIDFYKHGMKLEDRVLYFKANNDKLIELKDHLSNYAG